MKVSHCHLCNVVTAPENVEAALSHWRIKPARSLLLFMVLYLNTSPYYYFHTLFLHTSGWNRPCLFWWVFLWVWVFGLFCSVLFLTFPEFLSLVLMLSAHNLLQWEVCWFLFVTFCWFPWASWAKTFTNYVIQTSSSADGGVLKIKSRKNYVNKAYLLLDMISALWSGNRFYHWGWIVEHSSITS